MEWGTAARAAEALRTPIVWVSAEVSGQELGTLGRGPNTRGEDREVPLRDPPALRRPGCSGRGSNPVPAELRGGRQGVRLLPDPVP